MFACPCSLRSTQCAALIALAAAAGLVRIDPEILEQRPVQSKVAQVSFRTSAYIHLFFSELSEFNASRIQPLLRTASEMTPALDGDSGFFLQTGSPPSEPR